MQCVRLMFLLLVLVLVPRAPAQALAPALPAQPDADLLPIARKIMAAARYCALITGDAAGRASFARVVDPLPPDADMVVWVGTNPKSRKVRQLRRNPSVTLYYFDPGTLSTVSLSGVAKLVDAPAEKQRHWKEDWQPFYPDRDASFILVKVTPSKVEVMSMAHGVNSHPQTWAAPILRLPRSSTGR